MTMTTKNDAFDALPDRTATPQERFEQACMDFGHLMAEAEHFQGLGRMGIQADKALANARKELALAREAL